MNETMIDRSERYCIIGAGAAGLAACANFLKYDIAFDCLERSADTGGLWDYGNPANPIYESTHFISSSRLSGFPDFPMPEDYPDYPHHTLVLKYLRSYARHLGVGQKIEFNRTVENVEPEGDCFRVHLDGGETRLYGGVVIATGHNWNPKMPRYEGTFTGELFHSLHYKKPAQIKDKRVVIVGAGNSGCDIAVEAALHARSTSLSVRRGYYFVPKHIFGLPADAIGHLFAKLRTPVWIRQRVEPWMLRRLYGDMTRVGMPAPDHKLYESHPVINSLMFYYLSHGRIDVRPDIERFEDRTVHFSDGTSIEADTVIYATGYRYTYPFIDKEHLNWNKTYPDLFAHFFAPDFENLFMVGLYVNDGSFNVPAYYQSEVIARFIQAQRKGKRGARKLIALKNGHRPELSGGVKYMRNERHKAAVRHFEYIRYLRRLSAML